jgi:hypothetical protein
MEYFAAVCGIRFARQFFSLPDTSFPVFKAKGLRFAQPRLFNSLFLL